MKKLLLLLCTLLGTVGASAQTTGSLVTGYGDPLTLTQFKALAGTSGRFALVASSNTAADNAPRCDHWMLFTSTYNTTTLSEEALFYLEESSTDLYKVKRSSDGLYVSTSTSSTEFNGTGSEFKLVNRDPNDATKAVEGEYSISFEDPTNSTMHYNANAVKYNNGAGAWTTYAVFGPIYKVTVKFKDTNNESIQPDATYFVKANTALNAPIVSGYAVQGTSSYTITSDETVTFTYNNAIPAFDPNDVDGKTFTLQCARGYVYYNGSELAGTSDASQASKFAVVSYDNNTYLYDATQKKFVCHTTAATADNTGNAALESNDDFSKAVKNISFGSTDIAAYPYYVQEDEFTNWLNMDASPLVFFNRWTNFESGNGGNTYKIEIVDTDFDDFEAVATLKFYLDQTITYSPALGSWSGTGDYSNQWTSSFTNPQLTLKTSDSSSNINKADGGLYSTNNSTTTYVLTVPNGYLITGYSFKATPSTGATGMSITPDGGSAIAIPAAGTTISKTGLTSASAQFIVNGRYVQVSDFEVTYSEDPNVIRDLSNLSNSKSYYIKTKNNARGALSTYTDNGTTYLASPVKSALGISAKKFAILSYENNYYLYSVEDAKFVTYESANNAPLAATVTGTADAVAFSATTAPLYELRFDNSASKILNSSANYAYGVVINNWGASSNQWDDGCQYSIEIADDFDATDALAALEAFFHPSNYYDRVEAEVIPFLQDGNQNPSPTIGKPFGLSSSAATSIVQTYMTQLNNQQFNQTEYEAIVAIKDAGIIYPETGKYYLVKNNYNNKYLRVISSSKGDVRADLTAAEAAKDASAHFCFVESASHPYMSTQGQYLNWVYPSAGYEAQTSTNFDKYVHFVVLAPGVGAFCIALGNGEGQYAGYFNNGFYTLFNEETGVIAGSSNGAVDTKSQWTFEEVSTLDITLNGPVDSKYYATLCVPFDVTAIDGATAYTLAKDGTTLNMTEVTGTIAAGTPVLLEATTASATATISTAASSSISTETALTGQYFANTTFNGTTNYVLGTDGTKLGFFHWDGTTLGANRAYVAGGSNNVKGFYLNFNTPTAISEVLQGEQNGKAIYDLSGRRISQPTRGLYIVNGKKVVVK